MQNCLVNWEGAQVEPLWPKQGRLKRPRARADWRDHCAQAQISDLTILLQGSHPEPARELRGVLMKRFYNIYYIFFLETLQWVFWGQSIRNISEEMTSQK